jgi:two-component system sensor histidine kinase QseC
VVGWAGAGPYSTNDPDRFNAAAANLLANAQAHAASSILISYDPTSGRLIVEDDGPGVAFSDLHRLGGRFFRASNAPSGGSGLGLSIVLATVKAHGGQVQFLRSAGGGLRIEVTIPEQAQGPMHNSGKPVD